MSSGSGAHRSHQRDASGVFLQMEGSGARFYSEYVREARAARKYKREVGLLLMVRCHVRSCKGCCQSASSANHAKGQGSQRRALQPAAGRQMEDSGAQCAKYGAEGSLVMPYAQHGGSTAEG